MRWSNDSFISLRGLRGEELTQELNNVFSSFTDTAAKAVFGDRFADFQKIGEGYSETIFRVANSIEKAKVELDNLGISMVGYMNVRNKQGELDAEIIRESIVRHERYAGALSGVGKIMLNVEGSANELVETYEHLLDIQRAFRNAGFGQLSSAALQGAGGSDALADSLSSYFDKFYSDEERLAMMRRNLAEDFRQIGVNNVPKTREDFRKLVEAISKNGSEASQKLLARVLGLAEAFDEAAALAEQVTGVVEETVDKVKEAWQDIGDSIIDEINRIRGVVHDDVHGGLARAQSDFAIATGKARAGDQDAASSLPEMSRRLLEIAERETASAFELNRLRAMTAGSLEATLKLLKEQYGIDIPGFASGGDHIGGLRIVGERGPELEATGPSRIFSSQQTRAILTGDLAQEVRALRQEVHHLRKENSAEQRSIARSAEKMEKILTRNDTGNGLLTTTEL